MSDNLDKIQKELEEKKSTLEQAQQIYKRSKDEISTKAKRVYNFFSKYLSQLIMTILSFLLIGISNFAEANYNFNFFKEAQYWFDLLIYLVAQWLIILSVTTGYFKYQKSSNKDYLKSKNEIGKFILINLDTPFIKKYADQSNKKRKINAYSKKIKEKIIKLVKKYDLGSLSSVKQEIIGGGYDYIGNKEKQRRTLKNTLKKILSKFKIKRSKDKGIEKIQKLLLLIDDSYLNNNIDSIKVKHIKVSESILISGISVKRKEETERTFKENKGKEIAGKFGSGMLLSQALMMIFLIMNFTIKKTTKEAFLDFTFRALLLLYTYFKASAEAPDIFDKTILNAIRERENEINDYYKKFLEENKKEIN